MHFNELLETKKRSKNRMLIVYWFLVAVFSKVSRKKMIEQRTSQISRRNETKIGGVCNFRSL